MKEPRSVLVSYLNTMVNSEAPAHDTNGLSRVGIIECQKHDTMITRSYPPGLLHSVVRVARVRHRSARLGATYHAHRPVGAAAGDVGATHAARAARKSQGTLTSFFCSSSRTRQRSRSQPPLNTGYMLEPDHHNQILDCWRSRGTILFPSIVLLEAHNLADTVLGCHVHFNLRSFYTKHADTTFTYLFI